MKLSVTQNNILMAALVAVVSACGSNTTVQSGSGTGSNSTSGGSSTSGNVNNLPLAQTGRLELNGPTGPIPSVSFNKNTQTTLRVRLEPQVATNMVIDMNDVMTNTPSLCRRSGTQLGAADCCSWSYGGSYNSTNNTCRTNYNFTYKCLSFVVKVNGIARATQVLKVPGTDGGISCANAPTAQVLDFSDLTTGAAQPYTVTFEASQYDQCRTPVPNMSCAMNAVWKNHTIAATYYIQADGEYMPQ